MIQPHAIVSLQSRKLIHQAMPLGNSASQEASSRYRTGRRGSVETSEPRTLRGEPIEVRSLDSALGIVAGQIAVTEIVSSNNQDVRPVIPLCISSVQADH